MGTPLFAETILRSLLDGKFDVVAVYTQADKPSGRDQEVKESPVKILAESRNIPVVQPSRLDDAAIDHFRSFAPDLVIVAAYGKIVPPKMLDIPPLGCLNVHGSLLPKWRGASPVQNALLAGEIETGVTLMKMDSGMDTGPIIAQEKMAIDPYDTAATLLPKMADMGSSLLLSTLPAWIQQTLTPTPQDSSRATLCQLIEREDGKIFWNESAETIFNRYRGLTPWPGVFSFWKKDTSLLRIKFHEISFSRQNPETRHALGEVFESGDHIGVETASGIILLIMLQMEGKTVVSARDFVRGYPDFIGSTLE